MRRRGIRRLLIANRGEIALRVLRAARARGIEAVLAHSDVDADSLPARLADGTAFLGKEGDRSVYLQIDRVIDAAKGAGCDAVHPGYGFLSESAELAEACAEARLIFVGPSPATLRLSGDKLGAKEAARAAGVPVIPGSDGALGSVEEARAIAKRTGFPLLLKAAGGGGGKGIRLVAKDSDLESAFRLASEEARKAFGRAALYLEGAIRPARHVEVQILADASGRTVHLGERECSIQRRHQKLIEETPSTALSPGRRKRLCEAAVRVAKACRYTGAGTVEFLVDAKGAFYFLEVNARIQVEHPVTEMTTGIDLVAAQLAVAEGDPLPFSQASISPRGFAIEARVLAEDPYEGFAPSTGTLRRVRWPGGPGVRVDTAAAAGLRITPHYDSLLAKVVAWGASREEAAARLSAALDETEISGVRTTASYLAALLRDEAFLSGSLRTDLLESWSPPAPGSRALLAAAIAAAAAARPASRAARDGSSERIADAWALAARREGLR